MSANHRNLPLALCLILLAGGIGAQSKRKVKPCPYCGNDSKIMRAAGIVSHGPFRFGQNPKAEEGKVLTSTDIQKKIPFEKLLWIETRHIKLCSSLSTYMVPDNEKKKIRAELEELKRMGLRKIKPTKRRLDPWLRLHLYAMRAEKTYTKFLQMVRKSDDNFPEDEKHVYKTINGKKLFMGMGPYLGEKEKFEILLTRSMKAYRIFMETYMGLRTTKPQRHNFAIKGALFLGLSADMTAHRKDSKMHNSLIFNLAINCMDSYRFYAYNLPVWLTEGVGHYLERANSPRYNSFDGNEGSTANLKNQWKWRPSIRFLVAANSTPPLAKLFRLRDYGHIQFIDHKIIWSLVEFLALKHGDKFADLLDRMKGRIDKDGISAASDLLGVQRKAFKEIFGWTPMALEKAWKRHVLETYPVK